MEGWQDMTSNGYAEGELQDGPESSWFGHYSLSQKLKKQGGAIEPDFETYIENNKPVWFTDGEVSMQREVLQLSVKHTAWSN